MTDGTLKVSDHSRDVAGLKYVYPVVSRRAGGVSVGINLNTNNVCNWRCIYCQVPELVAGTAPPVDMALLEQELRTFLGELLHGDFMQQRVPADLQRINDIALSGNGEPTSAQEFADVVELVGRLMSELAVPAEVKLVLITNGSLLQRENVQLGLRKMARLNGEIWFKLDRASAEGMLRINDTRSTPERVRENLALALDCCPNTWLQTCWFALDGQAPSQGDEDDYLALLSAMQHAGRAPRGVLLYGLARASMQPEALRLAALSLEQMEAFAQRIRALGVVVKVAE